MKTKSQNHGSAFSLVELLVVIAIISVFSAGFAWADVKLPAIISNHMVLEKTARVPIWGKADPGEEVTVSLDGQTAKVRAEADGRWMTALNLKDSACGPFEMTVGGKNKLILSDVVVGEVWVASGQSNMGWPLGNTTDAGKEIARSANPLLRYFSVKPDATPEPLDDTEGQWVAASPETTGNFSGVAYHFAKKLQNELNVPVGLVLSNWGGSISEAWTSREAVDSVPELKASGERSWQAVKEYPIQKKAFVDGLSAWIKENGREDKPVAEAAVYAGMDVSTERWIPVKLPGVVAGAGLPKAGAVWLRKEVNLSKIQASVDLNFALPIDGYESLYWNGVFHRQTSYRDFPHLGYVRRHGYSLPSSALKEGRNILAIRLYEPVGPAKFPGEPKIDAFSLAGEWLAKAEYEFPALDAKKIAAAPRPPEKFSIAKNAPGSLFNAMIHPILPYAISGVIWYQGESNADRAFQYRSSFPLLISDWRKKWNQGDFSFYFCQLANFKPKKPEPGESAWAELREAQAMTLNLPNTGQAVLIDIGESEDIHPHNKKDAGERLAFIALAKDYGKPVPFSGPVYDSMKVENGKVILSFKHTDGGLVAKPLPETCDVRTQFQKTAPLVRNSPDSQIEGFAICGEDRKWVWANARINGNNVIVWSDKAPAPVAVRYAWADNPTCNLTNRTRLPAPPFRTDDFPPTTLNGKF